MVRPPLLDATVVWSGFFQDITERRRAELALQTANEEQEAILGAARMKAIRESAAAARSVSGPA